MVFTRVFFSCPLMVAVDLDSSYKLTNFWKFVETSNRKFIKMSSQTIDYLTRVFLAK